MKNNKIAITATLLILSIGNCFRVISGSDIRTVELLSIFSVGVIAGILIAQIYNKTKTDQHDV